MPMSTSKKRSSVQEVPAPAHLHRCYGHPHSRELRYKAIPHLCNRSFIDSSFCRYAGPDLHGGF